MDVKQRIRAYLALQSELRASVWPAYQSAARNVRTYSEACALDSWLDSQISTALPSVYSVHTFDSRMRARMLAHFEGRCAYCGTALPLRAWPFGSSSSDVPFALDFHVDHVEPRSQGGASNPSNYVPACRACNLAKHDKPLDLWIP